MVYSFDDVYSQLYRHLTMYIINCIWNSAAAEAAAAAAVNW